MIYLIEECDYIRCGFNIDVKNLRLVIKLPLYKEFINFRFRYQKINKRFFFGVERYK